MDTMANTIKGIKEMRRLKEKRFPQGMSVKSSYRRQNLSKSWERKREEPGGGQAWGTSNVGPAGLAGILAGGGYGQGLTCFSLDWQDPAPPTCGRCQPSPAFLGLPLGWLRNRTSLESCLPKAIPLIRASICEKGWLRQGP